MKIETMIRIHKILFWAFAACLIASLFVIYNVTALAITMTLMFITFIAWMVTDDLIIRDFMSQETEG